MSVTKAGLAGTDRRDGRGRTVGRGLSESRGQVQYVSTRERSDVPTYSSSVREYARKERRTDVLSSVREYARKE